jgi:uncharacterized membrane-anchored protein YjiN (DUF445 family)
VDLDSIRDRSGAMALSASTRGDVSDSRSDLARVKTLATVLLGCSVAIALLARAAAAYRPGFGYVAAWAEAAAVGGLADWFAVVALFRHPCGVPLPHTAIIASNKTRIADSFGAFIKDQFLLTDAIADKLRSVDFSALAAEWLADDRRTLGLSRFLLRLTPQALTAIEDTGLRAFVADGLMKQLRALPLAPFAAKLLSALVEDDRHQRIFDEVLTALNRLLNDEATLNELREKLRRELPTMFNLLRADAYLVRRFIGLVSTAIDEAKDDPKHPFRREFDHFVRDFIENLGSSREYADRAEQLKLDFLGRPETAELAEGLWQSVTSFLSQDRGERESLLEGHLTKFLAELGRKLATTPEVRAEINFGVVRVLQTFIDSNKAEIAGFVAGRIKSWDLAHMIDIIELNIGRDLQFIRLNGTLIGGLAGLGLYAGERAIGLQ